MAKNKNRVADLNNVELTELINIIFTNSVSDGSVLDTLKEKEDGALSVKDFTKIEQVVIDELRKSILATIEKVAESTSFTNYLVEKKLNIGDEEYNQLYNDFKAEAEQNRKDYEEQLAKARAEKEKELEEKLKAQDETPYLHVAYADSSDGSDGFSTTDSENKEYIGYYEDYTQEDSTDYSKYDWVKAKYELYNKRAEKELEEELKGQDGTHYLHVAYADSSDGSEGFVTKASLNKNEVNKEYIGHHEGYIREAPTDYSVYTWMPSDYSKYPLVEEQDELAKKRAEKEGK